jgi:mannose-6-phosphate isomerase-like protein (cupin superfamily)
MIIRNYLQSAFTLEPSHDGTGAVRNVTVFESADFSTNLRFIIYSELKPGTSIGYHSHGEDEEVYVILAGTGVMTVNNETREVGSGDVILNKPNWSHGLANYSEDDLCILVFEVKR